MSKKVIFLGAGASKADGAPLQRELFKSYFKACEDQNFGTDFDLKSSNIRKLVEQYFEKFFDLDESNMEDESNFPTFEEALEVLDLAIERNEKYHKELGNLYDYRTALIFSMAQAIQYKISASESGIHGEYHEKLIKNIYEDIEKGPAALGFLFHHDLLVGLLKLVAVYRVKSFLLCDRVLKLDDAVLFE